MRFICLDFETNGFGKKGVVPYADWPRPFWNYPIQVAVAVVQSDFGVEYAFDTLIQGATNFAPWVCENVPVNLEDLPGGKKLDEVILDLAGLLQEGDTIVAHNVDFDMNTLLAKAAGRLDIDTPELRRILEAPRFCTMRCEYSRTVFGKRPKLADLCKHFQVGLENAHDAKADTLALAECVSEALRRGVMLEPFPKIPPKTT